MVSGTGLLPAMLQEALGDLVFRGLITADSFTGLRALLTPLSKSTHREIEKRRRRRKAVYSMDEAGRWVRLSRTPTVREVADPDTVEAVALKLIQRYGVVFRNL